MTILPFKPSPPGEAFLAARADGRVGSSTVAKIVGLSTYGTARTVWLEMTGRKAPDGSSEFTEWGKLAETLIARWWAARQFARLRRVPRTAHPGGVPLAATPDYRIVGERAHLQVKTADTMARGYGSWSPTKAIATDVLPPRYIVQAQAEMSCFPLIEEVVFAVEFGAILRTYVVPRHEGLIALIEDAVERFAMLVTTDLMPRDPDWCPDALKSVDEEMRTPQMIGCEGVFEVLRTLPGAPVHLTISAS